MKFGEETAVKPATPKPGRRSTAKSEERNQRGESTRQLLLDTAERMIAERGVEGVSMRQIGSAVGQGNIAVIQYYFENKEGLVRAIIERRAGELENMRRAMLDDAKKNGKINDTRILLTILNLPIAMIRDDHGRSIYAAFMLQALKALWRGEVAILHRSWTQTGPVKETVNLLAQLRPDLTRDQLAMRILQINRLFVNAVVDRDRVREAATLPDSDEFFFEDVLNMMAGAFDAPRPHQPIAGIT